MPDVPPLEDILGAGKGKRHHPASVGKDGPPPRAPKVEIYTAAELGAMDLADTKLIVPRILPEGITMLVGKPKIGKSWLGLGLAVPVATGGYALGSLRVEQGDVLYIALEDTKRRLKKRLTKLMAGSPFPERLTFANTWPRIDRGGVAMIGAWIEVQANPRLVIIDTFARFRPRREHAKAGTGYEEDYSDVEALQALAGEFGVAILVLHHQRKAEADDPLDTISGTLGLGAAADGALILERERGAAEASLKVISRDLEEEPELALKWDRDIACWSIVGEGPSARVTPERRKILAALRSTTEAMSPNDIATETGLPVSSVRHQVREMENDGLVSAVKYGRYRPAGQTDASLRQTSKGENGNTGYSGHSGHSSTREPDNRMSRMSRIDEVSDFQAPLPDASLRQPYEPKCGCGRPGVLQTGDGGWWCGPHYPGASWDEARD